MRWRGWKPEMVNDGTLLVRVALTLLGPQVGDLQLGEYAASWDAFSFVDAKTGHRYWVTVDALANVYEWTTEQESIVECGICVDSTSDTVHG